MYTKIAKPTGANYTNLNIDDKTQYDDEAIIFDQSDIFYDGINESAWTDVAKPSDTTYTKIAKPT